MVNDSYTYDKLVVLPYNLEKIMDVKIEEKINEHTRIYVRGIIHEEDVDKYVESASDKEAIEVYLKKDNTQNILFKGIVTNINIEAKGNVRQLEIHGISATFLMDIQKKKRSFQNKNTKYKEVFEEIIKDYENGGFIEEILKGKAIEKLIVQYKETDWEFAKRLASHFNSYLAPNKYFNGPKFYIGNLKNLKNYKLEEFDYSIKKDLKDYKFKHDNEMKDLMEQNLISYEIKTHKVLELCQSVEFKNRKLYVCEGTTEIREGRFFNRYRLMDMKGLKRRKEYNKQINGVSILGNVKKVEKDMVKLQLDIDKQKEEKEMMWFQYSTIYSSQDGSGWYFMPEIGDRVKLYFPDNKEENAFVESSANLEPKNKNKRKNPSIKSLSTKYGKEIKFQKGAIDIICNGKLLMRLSDDGGVEINSNKKIQITSQENIQVNGSKIFLKGDSGINLTQKEANLEILDEIKINGAKVNIEW